MSCIKGSTVDACRIFFSLLTVSTRDSIVFPRLKSGWLCKSPELSADCGSPEHHIPYIIQNQYLSSHSVSSGIFFSFFGGWANKREAVIWELYPLLPTTFFSSFLPLLFYSIGFLHVLTSGGCESLGFGMLFSAECGIKCMNCLSLYVCFFFQHVCFPLSLGDFWFSTKFCSIKTWNIR